ncbi:MAG: DUF4339 domain-containing protein [Hyphomicrobiaceae bacterium]|nr:MAG: DUF4339 domain-containing protein [Hyphomicrobiaceae bacterium]
MPAPATETQWYLAREGQQYGPLTDAELTKFIELGHLQPTDLLWREGFPDWRPAMVVFPAPATAPRPATGPLFTSPGPAQETAARRSARAGSERAVRAGREQPRTDAGAHRVGAEVSEHGLRQGAPRGKGRARVILAVLLLAALGAAGWLAYPQRDRLVNFVTSLTSGGLYDGMDRKSLQVPPLAGLTGSATDIDAKMQVTALWRVIKREFPDWYAERLKEAAALAAAKKSEAEVGQHLARELVKLRRQQLDNALSAALPRLKNLAQMFHTNLVQLKQHSTEACYGFISQGEASPVVVKLLQGSDHTEHLQAQLTTVFLAIAEGRKTPRVYPQPRKTDYEMLAASLTKKGWTQADLQLFSDDRALARASPEKVCQLLQDWFAVQLAIKDSDAQLRLLVDSLRPVVAG